MHWIIFTSWQQQWVDTKEIFDILRGHCICSDWSLSSSGSNHLLYIVQIASIQYQYNVLIDDTLFISLKYSLYKISLLFKKRLKRHTDTKKTYSRSSVFTMEGLEHNVMNLTAGQQHVTVDTAELS